MITGVRGSAKTVMLTDIAKHFRKEKDWIVVDFFVYLRVYYL